MQTISDIYYAFLQGWRDANPDCMSRRVKNLQEKQMHERMSDRQYDRMLKETFPSSDPVAMY
jgi:hypothetical protein